MTLTLDSKKLISRAIRYGASKGITGKGMLTSWDGVTSVPARKMDATRDLTETGQENLLLKIFKFAGRLTNWISNIINRIQITATKIWDWVCMASSFIFTFDWNASDKSLEEQINQRNLSLGSVWGGVAGQSVGYLAGIGLAAGVGMLCPVIGGPVLVRTLTRAVGTEAIKDLLPALTHAILYSVSAGFTNGAIRTYINFRRWLKEPSNPIIGQLFGPDTAAKIRKDWGREGGPSWSMAAKLEESIENIKNPFLEGFVEEFVDEAFDSFVESGYVVAYEVDNAFEMNKIAQKQQFGPERRVVLEPDREAEEQTVLLEGPQEYVKTQVIDAINQHRFIGDRDVGNWIGDSVEDYARAKEFTQKITIVYYSVPTPPYLRGGEKIIKATYTVPDVERTKLDWETIKIAAGGENGVIWGRFRATAQLNTRRQMACYGSSEQEAEETLKRLLLLSDSKLRGLTVSEEKKEGARLEQPALQKEPTRIYPAFATVMVKRSNALTGKPELDGRKYKRQSYRFDLWRKTKPWDFEDRMRDLFRGNSFEG